MSIGTLSILDEDSCFRKNFKMVATSTTTQYLFIRYTGLRLSTLYAGVRLLNFKKAVNMSLHSSTTLIAVQLIEIKISMSID